MPSAPSFVPVPLNVTPFNGSADIRLELQRGAASVTVHWPVTAADACANWLREWRLC